MKKQIFILYWIVFSVIGCTYSVYMSSFPHLKTIRIMTFDNETLEYGIEEELHNDLVNRFQKGNLLKNVELSPDCQLEGTIISYKKEIKDYNSGIIDYELVVKFSVILTDLVKNKEILKKENIQIKKIFLSESSENSESSTAVLTEDEALKEIFEDLYKKIMEESFESW